MARFTDRVCLITGAASGIGRSTAIKMASQGCRLALFDLNLAGVMETRQLCDRTEEHYPAKFDVSNAEDVDQHVQFVANTMGRIDFVFNCAGVNPTSYRLTETTDAYWDKLMNTNLKGTYLVSRACIPHLEKQTGSGIVNVSSTMGIQAQADFAIYCATKFGVVGFTKALALELGSRGIRCNAVAPGYIDTPTNAGVLAGGEAVQRQIDKVALGRMGTGEEIADVVAFLFSEEARYMTGAVVEITGGQM